MCPALHSPSRLVGRAVIWAAAGQAGRAAGQIIFLLFLGRAVGPTSFGAATIAMVGYQLVITVATQSYSQALVHVGTAVAPEVRSTAFWLNLALSSLLLAAIVACTPSIAQVLEIDELLWLGPSMAAIGLLSTPTAISQAFLSEALDFRRIARIETISILCGTLAGITALFGNLGILSLLIFAFVQRLVELLLFVRISGALPDCSIDAKAAARLSRFTLPLAATHILAFFSSSIDQFFVGAVASAQTLGHFGLARRLTQQPTQMIALAVGRAMFPALVQTERSDKKYTRSLFDNWIRIVLAITTLPLFLLAVCAGDFVSVTLGSEWAASVPYIQLFAAVAAFLPVGSIFSAVLRAKGRTGLQFATAAGRAISSTAVLWLVAELGGGAWQLAVSTAVLALVSLVAPGIVAASILGVRVFQLLNAAVIGLTPGLAAAAVALAVQATIPSWADWSRLFLTLAITLLAWVPFAAAVIPEFRALARRFCRNRR